MTRIFSEEEYLMLLRGSAKESRKRMNFIQDRKVSEKDQRLVDPTEEPPSKTVLKAEDRIPIENIITLVCEHASISREILLRRSRRHEGMLARCSAIWLANRLTGESTKEIGRIFGERDAPSIVRSIKQVERRMKYSNLLRTELELLIRRLRS